MVKRNTQVPVIDTQIQEVVVTEATKTEATKPEVSKYHGVKNFVVICKGVEIDGVFVKAEGHESIIKCYKSDIHQVKHCDACKGLYAKERRKAKAASPVKAWKQLVEAGELALAAKAEAPKDCWAELDEIVAAGVEAQKQLDAHNNK
jgi:hypothetical protein